MSGFKQLHVAVIGGGIGGLAAAVSLRRAGHRVDIFERRGFDVEVGASISCAANGAVHLEDWGIDVKSMSPVALVCHPPTLQCREVIGTEERADEADNARLGDGGDTRNI